MRITRFLTALILATATINALALPVEHFDNKVNKIKLSSKARFIILPIQTDAPLAKVESFDPHNKVNTYIHVPLAQDKIDHYVTINIEHAQGGDEGITISEIGKDAICWKGIKLAKEYNADLDEAYRPIYHHSPFHGWMNDPNGMFYKDGRYHLCYQHNPHGNHHGDLHWGHSSSTDFIEWKNEGDPVMPDELGVVWSGSCIVDTKNAAGFGKNAVLAYYTSAGGKQTQSLAYSTDNGKTFTKYDKNPILTSEVVDFRDPKVIYHAASKSYVMVLAVGRNIEFYKSQNLKDWELSSKFGEDHYPEHVVRECPDLFPLKSPSGKEKWILISNNGGLPYGGSGAQYFIGDFDGKSFSTDQAKDQGKWLDYGKDNYGAVTWDNAPDNRRILIGWMNSWEYARETPTVAFRSANTIPRDLYLFEEGGETYVGSRPSKELVARRVESKAITPACEINFELKPKNDDKCTFSLENDEGEKISFVINIKDKNMNLERHESGKITYSSPALSPIYGKGYKMRIFLDKGSVECFVNDGKTVITSVVFPSSPYNKLAIDPKEGSIAKKKIYSYSR